jgi:hypothetical protein
MVMILRNDSYRGFDKKIHLKINVLKEVQRAMVEYDDEDIQALKAPTMMQQMMEMNQNASDDDEEDDEDDKTTAPPSESKKDQ